MITIRQIDPHNKKMMKIWADFPNKLYKDCPYYVPYLLGDEIGLANPKKNVAFDECDARYFLAYKGDEVVGRVAGIIQHRSNDKEGVKRVRLSRLDFVNDIEVVKALTKAVEDFGAEMGMDTVHGPFGFNDLDREGMRSEGFDKPATFATNYNYDYYLPLIQQCGYQIENVWHEYRIHVPEVLPDKVNRVAEIAKKRYGLYVPQEKSLKIFIKKYLKQLFDVYDEAYSVLPGTMPITPAMREQLKNQFQQVINKDYVAVVLNPDGDVVALGLAFPCLRKVFTGSKGRLTIKTILKLFKEKAHPTELEFAIIGALPGWDKKGAAALLLQAMHANMVRDGITVAESNPELVTNIKMQSLWNMFEREQHKKDVTVIKYLTDKPYKREETVEANEQ